MVTAFNRDHIEQLLARGQPAEALAVVARTLPKRYVVAWACECFKTLLTDNPAASDVDRAGLALAQQWLSDPTDDNCRAAMDFAEHGQFATPGVWIAASAGWNGPSLLPRGYDPIPPPDHLPAEAAVAALRLAASQCGDYAGAIAACIARALKIFGGGAQPAPQPQPAPGPQPAPQSQSAPGPQPAPQSQSAPGPQPTPQSQSAPGPQPTPGARS